MKPAVVELGLQLGLVELAASHPAEDPDDAEQHHEVEDAEDPQEHPGHRRADDPRDRVQLRAAVLHLPGQRLHPGGQQERQHEHDRRVAEGEPEARPTTAAARPRRGRRAACGWCCRRRRCGRRRTRAAARTCRRGSRCQPCRCPSGPGRNAAGTTSTNSTAKPTTCSSTMNPAIPAMDRRSCVVNVARIRDRTEPGAVPDVAVTPPPPRPAPSDHLALDTVCTPRWPLQVIGDSSCPSW